MQSLILYYSYLFILLKIIFASDHFVTYELNLSAWPGLSFNVFVSTDKERMISWMSGNIKQSGLLVSICVHVFCIWTCLIKIKRLLSLCLFKCILKQYWSWSIFKSITCRVVSVIIKIWGVRIMVINATFKYNSVISVRSVLLVEETGALGENHRPAASH